MTKADRVLSTPRADLPSKLSRRNLLGALAVAPVAGIPAAASDPALVAKFELLLDEYYLLRRRDWGPRLAQAHAETDALFGWEYDSENRENANRFFSEACARLDVHEAGDRMHAPSGRR